MNVVLNETKSHFVNTDHIVSETINIDNISLTKRETDVLRYVIQDYSAKKIARLLNISPRTVESYISFLKTKLNCKRKGEILLYILKKDKTFLHYLIEEN